MAAFVSEKVKAGAYRDADEVIEEGLELLKELDEQDRATLADLRKMIAKGVEQADRGELEDFDDGIEASIRAAGQKILATGRNENR